MIPRNEFNIPDIYKDQTCECIADYLMERINKASTGLFNYKLIKSTYTYDAVNIPNTAYPTLLVFRSSELYEVQKAKKNVNLVCRYGLVLPQQEQIMPLCSWVANEIHIGLNYIGNSKPSMTLAPTNRQVEYNVVNGQNVSYAYNFVNYYFSIRE